MEDGRPKKQKKKKANLLGISGYHRVVTPAKPAKEPKPLQDKPLQDKSGNVQSTERDVAEVLAEMASSPPSTHTQAPREPSPLPERSRPKEVVRKSQEEVISAAEMLANTSRPREKLFYSSNPYDRKMPERKPSAHFPVNDLPSPLSASSGHFPTSGHFPANFPASSPASGQFPTSSPASGHFPTSSPASGHFPTSSPASGHFPTISPATGRFPLASPSTAYFPTPLAVQQPRPPVPQPIVQSAAQPIVVNQPIQPLVTGLGLIGPKEGLATLIIPNSNETLTPTSAVSEKPTDTPDSKKSDVDISHLPPKLRRLHGK